MPTICWLQNKPSVSFSLKPCVIFGRNIFLDNHPSGKPQFVLWVGLGSKWETTFGFGAPPNLLAFKPLEGRLQTCNMYFTKCVLTRCVSQGRSFFGVSAQAWRCSEVALGNPCGRSGFLALDNTSLPYRRMAGCVSITGMGSLFVCLFGWLLGLCVCVFACLFVCLFVCLSVFGLPFGLPFVLPFCVLVGPNFPQWWPTGSQLTFTPGFLHHLGRHVDASGLASFVRLQYIRSIRTECFECKEAPPQIRGNLRSWEGRLRHSTRFFSSGQSCRSERATKALPQNL